MAESPQQEFENGSAWIECTEESQKTPPRQDAQGCRTGFGRCRARSRAIPAGPL